MIEKFHLYSDSTPIKSKLKSHLFDVCSLIALVWSKYNLTDATPQYTLPSASFLVFFQR